MFCYKIVNTNACICHSHTEAQTHIHALTNIHLLFIYLIPNVLLKYLQSEIEQRSSESKEEYYKRIFEKHSDENEKQYRKRIQEIKKRKPNLDVWKSNQYKKYTKKYTEVSRSRRSTVIVKEKYLVSTVKYYTIKSFKRY